MTPGQTGPFPSKQDDPKMSDPSHNHPSSSSTPIESLEDDASEARSTPLLLALVLGLFKLAAVGMVVYLTYFFTTTFAHRTPPSAPLSDEQIALAKKAEDLRAQGKKVLSSYGWVDPVTKSKVRIPIDRAMELFLAESNRPPAPPAPVPGPTADAGSTGWQTRNRRDPRERRSWQPPPRRQLPRGCHRSRSIAWSAWPVTTPTARASSSSWPCPPFLISPTPSGRPRAPTPSSRTRSSRGKSQRSTASRSRSCCP